MTAEEMLEIERIERLRSLCSHYFDAGRVVELAELFCEDAVCEYSEDYGGTRLGREAADPGADHHDVAIECTPRRGHRS